MQQRRRIPRHGFTLVELVVVIVILGILATIGLIAYNQVVQRASDASAQQSLSDIGREAQALAAFRGDGTLTQDDFNKAAGDVASPSSSGTGAAGWTVSFTTGDYSRGPATVHVKLPTATAPAGLARATSGGRCAFATVPVSGAISTWIGGSLGAACTGDNAALGRAATASLVYVDPANAGVPGVPTGVTGTTSPAAPNTVNLVWTAPSGTVASYQLLVDGNQVATSSTTSATLTGVVAGDRSITVVAVGGTGLLSSPSTAAAVHVPPAMPTSLKVSSTTANPVVLSWSTVTDAVGYRVYRDGNLLATLAGATPAGYTDSSVSSGSTYAYSVEAYAGGGTSTRTGTVSAVPGGYSGAVAAPGGLLGYWRLGETAGTTLADSSGNGRNATRLGTTPLGQASLLTIDPGNTSMTVDGSGSQGATVPSDATLNSLTALTIDMWIKTPASTGQQWRGLFDKDGTPPPTGGSTARDYDLFAGSADNVNVTKFCFSGGPFGETTWTLATPLAPNTAHHVVVTANTAGAQHLYVDGVDQGTVALSWAPRAQAISTAPLRLGMGDNNYWNGGVDEIALYSKVLTAAQVATQYQAGTHTP